MTEHPCWKVHTPNLLREVLTNPECAILRQPIIILRTILVEVAARAIELNDPAMNQLMLRLALYEQGDPESASYDPTLIRMTPNAAR